MVVAAVVGRGELALGVDRPAELAAPDDQRVVEQPALLQVVDQGRRGLVGVAALAADLRRAGCRAGPSPCDRAG